MKAVIILKQHNEKTGNTIELPFSVLFDKTTKGDVIGTVANEVSKGLTLLRKWNAKDGVKSNLPVNVYLKIADKELNTERLQDLPANKVAIVKGLKARLKINVNNPKSRADFFSMLNDIFGYMLAPIGYMTIQEFVNNNYKLYAEFQEDRQLRREFIGLALANMQ